MSAARRAAQNDSPEAVALRRAALAFAKHASRDSEDQNDVKGVRLNRELLGAACAYSDATRGVTMTFGRPTSCATTEDVVKAAEARELLLYKAAVVLGDVDDGIVDGSLIDDGPLEFVCDNVRPLVCDLLGHKPRCRNTSECREKLSWRPEWPIK